MERESATQSVRALMAELAVEDARGASVNPVLYRRSEAYRTAVEGELAARGLALEGVGAGLRVCSLLANCDC